MLPQHTLRSHVTPAQLYRPQAASRAGHRAGYRRTGSPAERDPGHHHHSVHAHHSAAVRRTQPPRERPAGRLVHPGHGAAPQQHQRREEQRDSRRVEQPRRTAATQRLLHAPPACFWQWLRALERGAERAGERARLLLPQRFGRLLSRDRQALQPCALRESGRLVQQGGLLLQRSRAGCKGCLALPQARQLRKASPPVSVVLVLSALSLLRPALLHKKQKKQWQERACGPVCHRQAGGRSRAAAALQTRAGLAT